MQDVLNKMRQDWDERARENARHYVATGQTEWTDEAFFASGEKAIAEQLLNDMGNVCQGKDPKAMRVLEIGCGAGRLTRALAKLFGEVHAVDVSGEMVERAQVGAGRLSECSYLSEQWLRSDGGAEAGVRFRVFGYRVPAHPEPRGD